MGGYAGCVGFNGGGGGCGDCGGCGGCFGAALGCASIEAALVALLSNGTGLVELWADGDDATAGSVRSSVSSSDICDGVRHVSSSTCSTLRAFAD